MTTTQFPFVKDRGLKEIAKLRKLTELDLSEHVTPAGVAPLQKALPECIIEYAQE